MNTDFPHRRCNPLTGEWVLVSPQRTERPWQGRLEEPPREDVSEYDPSCYLCPRNSRAGGIRNPDYEGTFVFDNDFPALLPTLKPNTLPDQGPDERAPSVGSSLHGVISGPHQIAQAYEAVGSVPAWLSTHPVDGVCRVICYSPRHDLSIAQLGADRVAEVVETWASQVAELSAMPGISYVQLFENKGEMMGCSNPHPHGQIWATSAIPNEVVKEDRNQAAYLDEHGACLLCSVIDHEIDRGERLVYQNDEWVALVPFWAIWPYELLLVPRHHNACLTEHDDAQRRALVATWQAVARGYDRLFQVSMPFSWGWHITPKKSTNRAAWHVHAHFYPPLLRSATVRKFMVGYEMLAGPQRDITAEQAAEQLRARCNE